MDNKSQLNAGTKKYTLQFTRSWQAASSAARQAGLPRTGFATFLKHELAAGEVALLFHHGTGLTKNHAALHVDTNDY